MFRLSTNIWENSSFQQYVDNKASQLVDQVWEAFVRHIPQTLPIEEDIYPHLPTIRQAYERHEREEYRSFLRHYVERYHAGLQEAEQAADLMANTRSSSAIQFIQGTADILEILQYLTPDPNLEAFEGLCRHLRSVFVDRISYAQLHNEKPIFTNGNEDPIDAARRLRLVVQGAYDQLLPRTQLLERNAYEDILALLDIMEGKPTNRVPIDVLNAVSIRLMADRNPIV